MVGIYFGCETETQIEQAFIPIEEVMWGLREFKAMLSTIMSHVGSYGYVY